jgi:hypothetical protein
LIAPSLVPFDVLRSSVTPQVRLDPRNGGSIIAEYRYVLTTERTGDFVIGPFEARLGNETVRSKPMHLVVRATRGGPGVPTVVARARIDTSLEVNFRALALPETVFVGQQANYEVAVFLNETVRDRLRRNPTFYPPDMQAMLAYDLAVVRGDPPRRKVGTRCFDALVYQRALFPLVPGRFVIPPAQLVYALPLSASFFSREESHELQTDSTVIVAVEPPESGRPADFSGAVGDLSVSARVDSDRGRVGDPLLLTVSVTGTGNVKLFPPPRVEIPWASLVRADERVRVDTAARRIRGVKEFDWVLTPTRDGELDLPPIRYSFFNPDTRQYETTASAAAHLKIAPGSLAIADTVRAEALLALRPVYRGPTSPPPHQRPAFWLVLALAPLPALGLRTRGRAARRRATPTPAAALRELERTPALAGDPCHVRRVFTTALADRLGINPEGFTRPGALARALRRAGVSAEVAADAEHFLRTLDEAAYSRTGTLPRDAATHALTLFRTADTEALARFELDLPRSLLLILSVGTILGAGVLGALGDDTAKREFGRGVLAYESHHFETARDAFAASAAREPWAADAWANLGTAAWAATDTARAVAGWQRALRLEPLATDARERLELIHTTTLGAEAFVPPVPLSGVLWLAALLWSLAWTIAALRTRGTLLMGAAVDRRWAYALGTVAVLLLLGSLDVDQRLAARRLGVLRTTTKLSADPALGGESSGSAIVGEVALMAARQGAWTRVVLDDGREGWVQSANVMSLERGTVPPPDAN